MVADKAIKDSGQRRGFKTGSVRDMAIGKGMPQLLSPIVEQELAKHFEKGGLKYGLRNWEKGQPLSELLGSARRHELKYRIGETDENHLIAWLWNVYCFVHTKYCIDLGILPRELDDLPTYLPIKQLSGKLGHENTFKKLLDKKTKIQLKRKKRMQAKNKFGINRIARNHYS